MPRRDIDMSFKPHPLTGDLATKTGSSAIKQSLINIVRSSYYGRGFNTEFGSGVDDSLFELITATTAQSLRDIIGDAIRNFEPQVDLLDVEVHDDMNNELRIRIYYTELNDPTEKVTDVILSRVR